MKFFTVISLISLFYFEYSSHYRACKTPILRALNFHSRLAPNKHNSLCPRVALNCCTNHDIMQMHKNWNTLTGSEMRDQNDANLNSIRILAEVFNIKDKLDLDNLTTTFTNKKKPTPKYENHIILLNSLWMSNDSVYY